MGKEDITHEGASYLAQYPRFSDWTHCLYTMLFSFLLGVLLVARWKAELGCQNQLICAKTTIDTLMLLASLTFLLLYMRFIHWKR